MTELDPLAGDDPFAILGQLPEPTSDRKLRLAAVAAYRWAVALPVPPDDEDVYPRPVYSVTDGLLDQAEALAEGSVSHDEAERGPFGNDGELAGLISFDPRSSLLTALEGAERDAERVEERSARLLLASCCDHAWRVATAAAWGYVRTAEPDHPWLDAFQRVHDVLAEKRRRLAGEAWEYFLDIHYRNGEIDYWHYAGWRFRADVSRTPEWDRLWAEVWEREWAACWAGVCPRGGERLQEEFTPELKMFADAAREEAWAVGPWDESPPPRRHEHNSRANRYDSLAGYRDLADAVSGYLRAAEPGRQAALLRDIFGGPPRPAGFDPTWRASAVVALATGIYAERAFDRLPVLADALEDAGCGAPDILGHCRGSGPHVRGCWVVDLVLGKE